MRQDASAHAALNKDGVATQEFGGAGGGDGFGHGESVIVYRRLREAWERGTVGVGNACLVSYLGRTLVIGKKRYLVAPPIRSPGQKVATYGIDKVSRIVESYNRRSTPITDISASRPYPRSCDRSCP